MRKIRKLLVLLLVACMTSLSVSNIESHAEEMSGEQASAESGMKDENAQRLEEVTGMNQQGEIFQVDDAGGIVENSGKVRALSLESVYVVNFGIKGNAVTNYKEYSTGVQGYTNGAYGADAAYLGTYGTKVRFMLSGVVGEVEADEVQVVVMSNATKVSCYKVSGGRLLHYISQDITSSTWASVLDNGQAPAYLKEGVTYYGYDGHYFYTDYETMLTDYQNDTRSQSVNAKTPFYNYYQYLPFRSMSSYNAQELNALIDDKTIDSSKMKNTGSSFVAHQNTYGVNALVMVGIAANESAWGKSNICQTKNNLFGLNAVDTSPGTSANTYESVDECIRQFADGWMSRGYLDPSDWRYKGGFLGNKGSGVNVSYASDPYWGEKAANVIHVLDKNGGNKDLGKYTIAIKDLLPTEHISVNVRSASSTSSAILYKTTGYSNYAVRILESKADNGFYKIASDGVVNAGRTGLDSATGKYDPEAMYAYISGDYITIVHTGTKVPDEPKDPVVPDEPKDPVVPDEPKDPVVPDEPKDSAALETTKLKGEPAGFGSIMFLWEKVPNASGYQIQDVTTSKAKTVATISSGTTSSYKMTGLNCSTSYKYRIRAFKTVDSEKKYGAFSPTIAVKTSGTVRGTINEANVNVRTGPATSYTSIVKLKKGTQITVTGNSGSWYQVSVSVKGVRQTAYVSKTYITLPATATVYVASTTLNGSPAAFDKVKLSWKAVSGASGYEIQRYDSPAKVYKTVKTITSGSTVTYTDGNLNANITFQYKIRAYKSVSGMKVYGVYSPVKSVKSKEAVPGTITDGPLNARKGPGTTYAVVTKLAKGTKVTVAGSRGDWYRVLINIGGETKAAYVSKQYVKLV